MKMKTIEQIRAAEILAPPVISLLASICNNNLDSTLVQNLDLLGLNYDNLKELETTIQFLRTIDIYTLFYTQTKTEEYIEMQSYYNQVLVNTAQIVYDFKLYHPVEIFSLYVYLYGNGYLSKDKNFVYTNDMKDFAQMNGLDVIRGKGVCRSISSFLVDLFTVLRYDATNLSVNATEDSYKKQQKLCSTELEVDTEGKSFSKVVIHLTKVLPIANHQITLVKDNNFCYLLDPTNDGLLHSKNSYKFIVPREEKASMHMVLWEQLYFGIFGSEHMNPNVIDLAETLSLQDIDEETFKEIYLRVLKICEENIDVFENLYRENYYLYKDICEISEKQRNFIERLFPIFPNYRAKESPRLKNLRR